MIKDPDSLTIEVKFYSSSATLSYNIPWSPSLYIQQAMEAGYDSVPNGGGTPFTFGLQYYGTYDGTFLGYMAIAVNAVFRSGGYIWYAYLNGNLTNNSLDGVALNPGDLIEFKYDTIAIAAGLAPGTYYHSLYKAENALRNSLPKYI